MDVKSDVIIKIGRRTFDVASGTAHVPFMEIV
jgi:hypothetical protein